MSTDTVYRDAQTGRYVTQAFATANPDVTVSEVVPSQTLVDKANAYDDGQQALQDFDWPTDLPVATLIRAGKLVYFPNGQAIV